jgi:hypothetical protein
MVVPSPRALVIDSASMWGSGTGVVHCALGWSAAGPPDGSGTQYLPR